MNAAEPSAACLPKCPPAAPVPLRPLSSRPLVSIVVPSFNQGRFIRETIDSILSQGYRPLEALVMDGGSKDETVDVLRSYGDVSELVWVSERDRGVVDAVNKGLARARGDVIAIQSSDDVYLPGAVSAAVEALRQHDDVGLVSGGAVKVDADGRELWPLPVARQYSLRDHLLTKTGVLQCSAFFRRELLEACGGWDERIPYTPDTDLWIRFAFRTRVLPLDQILSKLRMHDEQRDTQAARIVRDYWRMIEQSPDLAQASPELRQAAEAGKHLLAAKYNPWRSDWRAAWHVARAGWLDPDARDRARTMRLLMLPVLKCAAEFKRRLGGVARPSPKM